jgi:hypothetical protein
MKAVFEGLVFDENGNPAMVTRVGDEPMYIVDDAGFKRHIPSEQIDRQVIAFMLKEVEGHEDLLTDQTAKMLGQDDPFSRAAIASQWKNIDQQFEAILQTGIPEDMRAYLGMMGLRIVVNLHGDVLEVNQPGMIASDDEE